MAQYFVREQILTKRPYSLTFAPESHLARPEQDAKDGGHQKGIRKAYSQTTAPARHASVKLRRQRASGAGRCLQ